MNVERREEIGKYGDWGGGETGGRELTLEGCLESFAWSCNTVRWGQGWRSRRGRVCRILFRGPSAGGTCCCRKSWTSRNGVCPCSPWGSLRQPCPLDPATFCPRDRVGSLSRGNSNPNLENNIYSRMEKIEKHFFRFVIKDTMFKTNLLLFFIFFPREILMYTFVY